MFKKKKTSTLSCQYRFPEHQLMLTISQSLFTLSISPLLTLQLHERTITPFIFYTSLMVTPSCRA